MADYRFSLSHILASPIPSLTNPGTASSATKPNLPSPPTTPNRVENAAILSPGSPRIRLPDRPSYPCVLFPDPTEPTIVLTPDENLSPSKIKEAASSTEDEPTYPVVQAHFQARPFAPTRPATFPGSRIVPDVVPIPSSILVPFTTHVLFGIWLPPLQLPALAGPLVKVERQSLRPPERPCKLDQERWGKLRDINTHIDIKGRRRAFARQVEKKTPETRIEGYTLLRLANKNLWKFNNSKIPNRTLLTSPPNLPKRVVGNSNPIVGPFARLALIKANHCANRDRSICHALVRESRAQRRGLSKIKNRYRAEVPGEVFSFKSRWKSYGEGLHHAGHSGLRNEVVIKEELLVEVEDADIDLLVSGPSIFTTVREVVERPDTNIEVVYDSIEQEDAEVEDVHVGDLRESRIPTDSPLIPVSTPSPSPIPTQLDESILEITQAFANCYHGIKRKREDVSLLPDDDESRDPRPAKHLCKGFQFRRIPSTRPIVLGKRKWDDFDSEGDTMGEGSDAEDGDGNKDEGGRRAKRVCLCLRTGGPTWATWKGLGKRK